MSTLFRNTFYTSLAQAWQMLMAMLLFMLVSRRLGESGFGSYTLATTIMYFVLLFDDIGLNTLAIREIAKKREHAQSFLNHVFTLKVVLLFLSASFLTAFNLLKHYDAQTSAAIWIFGLCGVAGSFSQMAYAVFRAYERMELESVVTIIEKTLSTGLGILVIVLGMGLISLSWMFALTACVALFLSLFFLKRLFFRIRFLWDPGTFRTLFMNAAPFGIALFMTTIYGRIDILMLSMWKQLEAVGLYGAAQKLLNYTSLIPVIFATAFFPRFSVLAGDRKALSRVFTTGFKYLLMLAIPIIPSVWILADKLILFFAGRHYVASAPALRVMAFTAAILFLNIYLASLYGAANHQKRLLVIQLVGLIVNITSNAILIPRFSFMGAAYTTLITEGIVLILTLIWFLKRIASITEYAFLPKVVVASTAMTAYLCIFRSLHLLINIGMGALVYFAVLFLIKGLDLRQIQMNLADLKPK